MKTRIVAAAILTLCVGCGIGTWVKPGGTAEQFEADRRACIIEAESRAHNCGASGNPFVIRDFLIECLKAKGWTEAAAKQASSWQGPSDEPKK